MARFKVLASKHQQREALKNPDGSPVLDRDGNQVEGPVTYGRGAAGGPIVESDKDLVALFGSGKFEKVEAPRSASEEVRRLEAQLVEARNKLAAERTAQAPPPQSNAFPGGQVSEGFQQATGTPEGTVSGILPPDMKFNPKTGTHEKVGPEAGAAPPARGASPAKAAAAGKGKALPDDLEGMTVQDLKDYAADEEIDLKGHTLKADIIDTIRDAKR